MAILLLLFFIFACGKGPTGTDTAFFEAASFYDGSEQSAGRALAGLKAGAANTDNLNMVVMVCADQVQNAAMRKTCEETLQALGQKGDKESFSPQLTAARSALVLHEVLTTERDLCSDEVKALPQERDTAGILTHLNKGVAAFCATGSLSQNSIRHEKFVEFLDENRSDTVSLLRSVTEALLFWPTNPAEARLYYRGQRLLSAMKFSSVQSLLDAAPASAAKTLIAVESGLVQNLVTPREAKGSRLRPVTELAAVAEKSEKCKTDLCRFTAAKAHQLLGEHHFQRRRFGEAVKAFSICRAIGGSNECLEQSALARLAGGKKIPEDDQVLLKNLAGRGFVSNFLGHAAGESGAFELRDRFMQSAKKLPNHKMQAVLEKLVKEIKTHPYLRGRAPFEINVYVTESKDAVAHFVRGTGYIFIGDKFLSMLEQATKGSEFSLQDILAVTLGHEIHHLVAGHGIDSCNVLSHADQFAFGRAGVSNVLVKAAAQHESWRREFEADENGMLYAFLTGKKAGAFLATLYTVGREEKSGGNATHPATLERIRVLREKMQILSVAATAFNRANDSLKEMDKTIRAGKSPSDSQLQATERDLLTFSEIVPGFPAAHANLSFVALRRILNRVRSPEMPTMAMMNAEVNLVPPAASMTSAASGKTCKVAADICSIRKWRPGIAKGWDKTTVALVRSAQTALERAVATFPDDYRLQNNLALTWYYLAEAELMAKADLGCGELPAAQKKRLQSYLVRAEKHFNKAQANSPETVQDIAHNRAALEIARFHITKDVKNLKSASAVFLIAGKGKELSLKPGLRYNDSLAFAVGYARTLELYLHLANQSQGREITDVDTLDLIKQEAVMPAKEFLAGLTAPRAMTHWQKELAALVAAVDKVLVCEEGSTPPGVGTREGG